MPAPVTRRAALALPAALAAMSIVPATQAAADDKVLRVGTLKLIHGISVYFYEKFAPAGYTVEVIPFESPTDGKNAVVTGTVDTCIHGIAAVHPRRRGRRAGRASSPTPTIAAWRSWPASTPTSSRSRTSRASGSRIWPGSTQEAVILERLRMEGMSIKDIQPIRLQFSDHPAALARGDIDAYVGAEPGPGISLANGTGMLVEYPYSTPIGSLNMILSASEKRSGKTRSASG